MNTYVDYNTENCYLLLFIFESDTQNMMWFLSICLTITEIKSSISLTYTKCKKNTEQCLCLSYTYSGPVFQTTQNHIKLTIISVYKRFRKNIPHFSQNPQLIYKKRRL